MSELSETFWITFTTMGFAFLTGTLAYILKSKCSHVKCLGCLEITRDIDAELEEGSVPVPGTLPVPLVPVPLPERRGSLRNDSNLDARVAEAVSRYASVRELNQPPRDVTRSNSFT